MNACLAALLFFTSGFCLFQHDLKYIGPWNDISSHKRTPKLQMNHFADNTLSLHGMWQHRPSDFLPHLTSRKRPHFPIWSQTPGVLASQNSESRASRPIPYQDPMVAPLPTGIMDILPKTISKVMNTYGRSPSGTSTTTAWPPVIWFPNQNADCEQDSRGGDGFSTFSLLALAMSVTNLVGILANNANNNINNNNNDNNVNNNNVQDANENNANNNDNIFTMITFGGGRRKKRNIMEKELPIYQREHLLDNDTNGDKRDLHEKRNRGTPAHECWLDNEYEKVTAEEIAAVVSLTFIRAQIQAMITDNPDCLYRSFCRANADAVEWGGIAEVLAEALSSAHIKWISMRRVPGTNTTALAEAAFVGRASNSGSRLCHRRYQCPMHIQKFLDDDEAMMRQLFKQ
ncbi:hypothetical protein SK128_020750 [Halocaridina rubra]|uniref:Uncharacterized protein n=1 Tax=Halocaridina rubra TaxID=373956 RepID=A0AAN8WU47_HALRR